MKATKGERIFSVFNIIFMILLSLIFIIPFITVISTSFVSEQEAISRGSFILIPRTFDLGAYKLLLSSGSVIFGAYGVTLFRVVVGTSLNLFFTATLAYGLSKKNLPGNGIFTTMVFITMLFGGGLIPTFLLIKSLGLYNNIWVMVVPNLVNVWNMFLMRNFFYTIPAELEESAIIDGATPLVVLIRIIFPLSLASFATIGLFYAVTHWNSWFDALIYINDIKKMPVQVIMRNIVLNLSSQDVNNQLMSETGAQPPAQTLKSAVIIVSTIPILFIYPFIQKYFVKGMMVGAIKG